MTPRPSSPRPRWCASASTCRSRSPQAEIYATVSIGVAVVEAGAEASCGDIAARRRHRDVPGQGRGARRRRGLRPGHARPRGDAPEPRARPPQGALDNGELTLHYQPIVACARRRSSASKRCCAGRRPTLGPIAPALFIPIAEDTGLIVEIGAWVLETACAELARWRAEIPGYARSVRRGEPVGPPAARTPHIVDETRVTLQRTQLPASARCASSSPSRSSWTILGRHHDKLRAAP